VELIVVIFLLAILMALLFPGGPSVDAARRAQAGTDVQSIVTGIKSYMNEYGCLPGETDPSKSAKDDSALGDFDAGLGGHPNSAVFDILRNISSPANPNNAFNKRQIVFIESKVVPDPRHPRGGFVDGPDAPAGLGGCFLDPWGHQYGVVMDANHDGKIDVTRFYQDFTGEHAPGARVGAFSLGKDGQLGKKGDRRFKQGSDKSDDIISWAN
jgi:type II secretory pathway pseudopilin PulG